MAEAKSEIARVGSFDEMFAALEDTDVKAALLPGRHFAQQAAIEAFNRAGKDVYVVMGAPLSGFKKKLSDHLEKKGLTDDDARAAFVDHVYELTAAFLERKKTPDGGWDVTVTSTFLHNTKQRQWHIDSYDATGNTYQLTCTLAGQPGTLLSQTSDYDRARFEALRDERREREIAYRESLRALAESDASPGEKTKARTALDREMTFVRKRMVDDMEILLAEMKGIGTLGQDVVLFRGGDVPHSSPVLDRRRLVFTMVEFDEFMDLTHASREY